MDHASLSACEYVLIRVAPDPIRNEHVNVGVALYQPEGGFAGVRFNRDLRRVRCLFPQWEEADLQGLEAELMGKLQPGRAGAREYFFHLAQETFSHALQITPPTLVLTQDPVRELDLLYQRYAAPPPEPIRAAAPGARREILRHLQRVFAEERILPHLARQVRAGAWLSEPDTFCFDFHYQPNGLHHVIQALPLEGDEGAIKAFCFTVEYLRTRLGGLDVASFEGRSGLAPSPDPSASPAVDFHRELLTTAGVRVLRLDEAPAEAARIRAALGIA